MRFNAAYLLVLVTSCTFVASMPIGDEGNLLTREEDCVDCDPVAVYVCGTIACARLSRVQCAVRDVLPHNKLYVDGSY